jgi:esterase/lipase
MHTKHNVTFQQRDPTTRPTTCMIVEFFALVFFFLLFLYLFGLAMVSKSENKILFNPTPTHQYINVSGELFYLDSGGAVLHYQPKGHAVPPRNGPRRKILFLHGNSDNLDIYGSMLELYWMAGYELYAIEYAGYGVVHKYEPTPARLLENVREAWIKFGDRNTILMGFSIGGILMGQLYDVLVPQPAQLVFLNTFASLPELGIDLTNETTVAMVKPFMSTANWITRPPQHYHGRVLIVGTKGDVVTPVRHSYMLYDTFRSLDPQLVLVQDGGHEVGPFLHFAEYQHLLLSPFLHE